MKRFSIPTLVLALSLVFASSALAAIPYTLFGDAVIVPGGNPGNAAELTSTFAPPGFGGARFEDPVGALADLDYLSADYKFTANSCGGGAPRFQIRVTDGVNTENIFVYLGPPPNYTLCPMNVWTSSGNLVDPADLVDTSQLPGGAFYDTYLSAQAKYGAYDVLRIVVVTDSSWFFGSDQVVLVDNVMINQDLETFENKDSCKKGGWHDFDGQNGQPGPFKNQGDCVSYFTTGGRNPASGE